MEDLQLEYEGTAYWLSQDVLTLGRSSRCTIVVRSRLASREHACIRRIDGAIHIQDLGSKNGTRVSGQRLRGSRRLSIGDVIQIGDATLEVTEPRESAADRMTAKERWLKFPSDKPPSSRMQSIRVLDEVESVVSRPPPPVSERNETIDNARAAVDEVLSGPLLTPEHELRIHNVAKDLWSWDPPRLQSWWQDVERRVEMRAKQLEGSEEQT